MGESSIPVIGVVEGRVSTRLRVCDLQTGVHRVQKTESEPQQGIYLATPHPQLE
jgi:hypothetical protein